MKEWMRNKYFCAALLIVAAGIVLAMLFPSEKAEVRQTDTRQMQTDEETRLAQILSCIDGAGQVQVMITYASGAEIVPAYVSSVNTSQQDSQTGTVQSSSTRTELASAASDGALVLKELSPPIRGVVIVAQGADDPAVKIELLQAAVTVLQIDADQVDVFTMGA